MPYGDENILNLNCAGELKFGMNKWGIGPGPTHDWVIYYDNLKIGRSVSFVEIAPVD